jgi:flagellin-specific chaperone FliS
MLGNNKNNIDLSTNSLKGFHDLIGKYLNSKEANNEIVEQLKDGFITRFKDCKKSLDSIDSKEQNIKNEIVENIINELNKWLSKKKINSLNY